MLYVESHRRDYVVLPRFLCLSRKSKHQVDAYVVETSLLSLLHCGEGLLRGVASPQERQASVVESLHTQAQSVYTHTAQPFEVCHAALPAADVIGITFYGDFSRAHIIYIIYSVEKLLQLSEPE